MVVDEMAGWLLLATAAALCGDAGAGYADYSAARMPQYDSVNYDSRPAAPPADDYRDRSVDVPASIDYNNYDQESNVKKRPKTLDDEDSWQIPFSDNNLRNGPKTAALDESESEYNYNPQQIVPKLRFNKKRTGNVNRSKIRTNKLFTRRPNSGRNSQIYQQMPLDDEDTEVPTEHLEDEKFLDSESDKSKFVRRDIRPKIRRKSDGRLRQSDYDEQSDVRDLKDPLRVDGRVYSDQDPLQNAPNVEAGDDRPNQPTSRTSAYTSDPDDSYDPQMSSTPLSGRQRAPMPKPRKKVIDYVDYNDMSRIEKIKSISSRISTARPGAQRWSFRDNFRRFNQPMDDETRTGAVTTTRTVNATIANTVNTTTNPTPTTIYSLRGPIAPLPNFVLQNITDFVNKSKQLSIAEKSQLSILKKAQRKDSVKDEMLKNKPPVLLQVTERLQTVVMVEPPVSQEPWLRARDIAEDSPERIEKVKRFMRNKLVANARNISELMENWDDTVCDYIDISLLDENSGGSMTTYISLQLLFVITLVTSFNFCHE